MEKITLQDCEKHAEKGEFSVISDGKLMGFETEEERKDENNFHPLLH